MADFFTEMLADIDKLTDEQVSQLMAALECKKTGCCQAIKDNIKDNGDTLIACPHCGSISVKKHGKADGRQRYRCKDCCKTFCETSQTLLHHSRLSPAQWRGLLLGIVQNLTLDQIADIIGTSVTAVWYNKHKVCIALENVYRDYTGQFIDIAECDEWYTPVSFKGKRDPAFFIRILDRMPRHNRTYEEKVEYLMKNGLYDEVARDPARLARLLGEDSCYKNRPKERRKRGISNDQTCVLTCRDRSGHFTIEPICIGPPGTVDIRKNLSGRFAGDAILVTDSRGVYSGFAKAEGIQLEQIESSKFTKGAYNLGRIDAVHSKLSAFYPDQEERAPATKYLGLQLKLFWWLEVNGALSTQDKVDKLYDLMTSKTAVTGADYESITNRELTLNTKGCFPTKV